MSPLPQPRGIALQSLSRAGEKWRIRLCPERFDLSQWSRATVNIDYHIAFDGIFYSVPYTLVQQVVEVRSMPARSRSSIRAAASLFRRVIASALSRERALARADGSLRHLLVRLARIDVLVIDDWAMALLNENERREISEICEDRYQTRSSILTSQLPISRWHEQIGDPTIADGILDRLVRNAYPIELRGESMRKERNPPHDNENDKKP
jgi:IstB-like ATP binding protein/Mu transposase-like protein